jgi:hypothetical protein
MSVVAGVSVNVKPGEQTMASYGFEIFRIRTRIRTSLQTKIEMNSEELTN